MDIYLEYNMNNGLKIIPLTVTIAQAHTGGSRMDIITYSKYPFLQEASAFVKDKGYSIESIVSGRAFERVRLMAKKRVMDAITGEPSGDQGSGQPEIELLSYPVARMMVAIVADPYLSKRYAVWESKRASALLASEDEDILITIGKDFGITTRVDNRSLIVHFTDYLRYSSSMKDMSWKLINRRIEKGSVFIPRDSYARLLEEAIRDKVQSALNVQVPEALSTPLEPYLIEIRDALNKLKAERNMSTNGEVSQDAFPPCMSYLLSELQKGTNLPHTARFGLTSFLANIGLDKDKIMDLYRMAPDFREDLTRYQVEHICGGTGTEYTCPSCKTMITYGNCYGKNKMCEWVTHPLSYYRKAQARRAKLKQPGKTPPDKVQSLDKPVQGPVSKDELKTE